MREIQSLARGLRILNIMADQQTPQSVTELAQILDIDKSTVSRLLGTMESYGYVQQERTSRQYVLGKQFYMMGWHLVHRYSLGERARPYITHLARITGECSHIGVYSAGKAMVIEDIQPETSLLRVVGQTGRLLALHNTALGKVFLAFSDIPYPEDMPQLTEKTITDIDTLQEHMNHVRHQGYALDDEENEVGVRCLAAPVFNDMGMVVGSVGISGPKIRLPDSELDYFASMVIETALLLSRELGFQDNH